MIEVIEYIGAVCVLFIIYGCGYYSGRHDEANDE